MSKNDILYVKGMNISESERDDEDEDIWDDSKLNDAYDKALRIANAEVARRVAMSTNTQPSGKDAKNKVTSHPNPAKSSQKKQTKIHWKAGMPCRAVYEEDGLEYEAFLLRIINDKECVVRFLGYENSEIVPISSLKQTLGKTERTKQIEEALADKSEDGFAEQSVKEEQMECSDRPLSPGSTVSLQKRKKSGKKKNKMKHSSGPGFELPDMPMPMPMPNISLLRNLGAMDMPIPPPPQLNIPRAELDSEDQAVTSMLLSWYMSGYYTGLYQGMKRAKEERRN